MASGCGFHAGAGEKVMEHKVQSTRASWLTVRSTTPHRETALRLPTHVSGRGWSSVERTQRERYQASLGRTGIEGFSPPSLILVKSMAFYGQRAPYNLQPHNGDGLKPESRKQHTTPNATSNQAEGAESDSLPDWQCYTAQGNGALIPP